MRGRCYLHGKGSSDTDDDTAVVVIDGDEERRLGDVHVEGGVNNLVIAVTARLFQRRHVTTAARIAYHNRNGVRLRRAGAVPSAVIQLVQVNLTLHPMTYSRWGRSLNRV